MARKTKTPKDRTEFRARLLREMVSASYWQEGDPQWDQKLALLFSLFLRDCTEDEYRQAEEWDDSGLGIMPLPLKEAWRNYLGNLPESAVRLCQKWG